MASIVIELDDNSCLAENYKLMELINTSIGESDLKWTVREVRLKGDY